MKSQRTDGQLFKSKFLWRIWRSWKLDFTDSGRALVIGGIVATTLGSSPLVDTYLLLFFFFFLGLFSLLTAGLMRPRVKISHNLPHRIVCGERVPFTVRMKNLSRFRAWDVVVQSADLDPSVEVSSGDLLVPCMEPGEEIEMKFLARFAKRGSFLFKGFQADTVFPCGFVRLARKRAGESSVLVYPWFYPLQRLQIPTGRRYQPGGVALASLLGDSMEYIGNREYQPGDRIRDIDWRSWARLGEPIVREYQEEYFCRIALVLDTQIDKKRKKEGYRNFEAGMSLAAGIADFLSRQEYLIDLFAAGPQIYIMEAGRSLAHLDQILDVLACLEPCEENPYALIEPVLMERIGMLTTVIVVLLDMDQARMGFLQRLDELDVGMKVIVCNSRIDEKSVNEWPKGLQVVSPESVKEGIASL